MTLRLALMALVASSGFAHANSWPAADTYINASFVCDSYQYPDQCRVHLTTFPDDYAKAIAGDYAAQQNVAYCFESGCNQAVKANATLACAWHVVIIGSGHLQASDLDRRFAETACRKLDRTGRATAERQASTMLKLLGVE